VLRASQLVGHAARLLYYVVVVSLDFIDACLVSSGLVSSVPSYRL